MNKPFTSAKEAYECLVEVCLFGRSTEDIYQIMDEKTWSYGTASHEKLSGAADFHNMIKIQRVEMADLELEIDRKPILDKPLIENNIHLFVEEFDFHISSSFQFTMRLTAILLRSGNRWMVPHAHASTPDQNIPEGSAMPIEELRMKNLELENRVQERTSQLNRSLEDLRQTQNQLIQSEKMASLGELTAGIAHEIQNPLNFVNNFSEINKELSEELIDEAEKGDIDEVKAIAKDINENEGKIAHHGKRAEGIVKSMLQHSRANSGEREPTDINALCDEYLRLSYHGLRAKDKSFNAEFKLDLDNTLPKLNVVPQDIGRVLLNLINNAFQAVRDVNTPVVTVSTKQEDDHCIITVSDNGRGIPDDIKDKIFEPFFTTKPTGEGTGLGLSMSYDIVTKGHSGTLEVSSIKNSGTKFIVTLPTKTA